MKVVINASQWARLKIDFTIIYGEERAEEFMAAHFIKAEPLPGQIRDVK